MKKSMIATFLMCSIFSVHLFSASPLEGKPHRSPESLIAEHFPQEKVLEKLAEYQVPEENWDEMIDNVKVKMADVIKKYSEKKWASKGSMRKKCRKLKKLEKNLSEVVASEKGETKIAVEEQNTLDRHQHRRCSKKAHLKKFRGMKMRAKREARFVETLAIRLLEKEFANQK